MTARWKGLADRQHIGSAWFRGRDMPSLDPLPRRTMSPPPTRWSQARLHVCEQRSARTKPSLPPNRASRLRGVDFFHGPSCALPDIFLKDSPKDTPDENKRRERLQTWRLDAMCSIKNPFRIGNVYLGNAKQIVGIFKIPH